MNGIVFRCDGHGNMVNTYMGEYANTLIGDERINRIERAVSNVMWAMGVTGIERLSGDGCFLSDVEIRHILER